MYNFLHCIGINGKNLDATKPDLVDRGLVIEHTSIPKPSRLHIWHFVKSSAVSKGETLITAIGTIDRPGKKEIAKQLIGKGMYTPAGDQ